MYRIVRPLIFRLNPETAHYLTLRLLQVAGASLPIGWLLQRLYAAPDRPVEAFGLHFRNPIGLAAGYDKDGLAWRGLAALGFGHIEIGTVTPRPQPGNPKPRLFRLPEDEALINRLGFPGRGAAYLRRRLAGKRPPGLVLGVNIGKNKDTPNEEAAQDYVALLKEFAPLADYIAVNVSSPNTVGLRRLQARAALEDLLSKLKHARAAHPTEKADLSLRGTGAAGVVEGRSASSSFDFSGDFYRHPPQDRPRPSHATLGTPHAASGTLHPVPLLVKLSPDLSDAELDDALAAILGAGMDGVIATNTTIDRQGLRSPLALESGGLSGAPLREKHIAVLAKIVRRLDGALPVVAVGGVMGSADARARLDAGASLVQVYTGLIYEGPGLVKSILSNL
jgi:dihydroorotate dehydrogenase